MCGAHAALEERDFERGGAVASARPFPLITSAQGPAHKRTVKACEGTG
jgi:hypothetical protein